MLNDLYNLVKELNTTNSSNKKKEILIKYPQCKELLIWVYSYKTLFNVTSKNVKKRSDLKDATAFEDIIELLTALNNRDITGHAAISAVNAFIEHNSEFEDLIYLIIDKNLKTRTDTSLINKVWPGLIPTFDVQLAIDYEKQKHKVDYVKDEWRSSRKLDGVRCIVKCNDRGIPSFFSREGREFTTLNNIKEDIMHLPLALRKNKVFDGEICIVDENGNENYKSIMNVIKKKNFTIPNPRLILFDYLKMDEFLTKKGKIIFSKRYEALKLLPFNPRFIVVTDQILIKDEDHFQELRDEATDNGWEGLIIRKDVVYKGKRSNDMLKVKKFHDAEYTVVGIETGLFRIIDKVTKLEREEDMLTRVNILHKGNVVGVGSGFSISERQRYFLHPEEIIGKEITVRYFETTKDKNGKESLRFPTVKFIFENGRDV